MERRVDFTRRDIVVVLGCASLVLLNIAAIGSGGRERAKRVVCLANLNKLTAAWILYADDNDGRLVNGTAGTNLQQQRNEPAWVGRDWSDNYGSGQQLRQELQEIAIKDGALWPYCRDVKLYHCPSGRPAELRNYSIVDSMNGYPRTGTNSGNMGVKVGQTVLWVKHMSEIHTPGPAQRAVFIDEGWITPDSYAVQYQQASWWDDPPVRHSDGATLSFADAHGEHFRWKGQDTIEYGRIRDGSYMGNMYSPNTGEGMADLQRVQTAVWGRLGYSGYQPEPR